MAKKGKTTKKPVESGQDVVEARPSAWSYVKATLLLFGSWLKRRKLRAAIVLLAAIAATSLLIIFLQPSSQELTNDQIVTRVNKELSITGDGNPAILTVEDKTKATQPFLSQAENGDKVLLYYKAKKAVLFRPRENRIVHQGSYTPPDAKVFIRKGTTNDNKVNEIKDKLKAVREIEIVSQDNSPKTDYAGVVLVSVTDRYDEKIRELENLLNTQVVRLPAGETFPDADILIIVGD